MLALSTRSCCPSVRAPLHVAFIRSDSGLFGFTSKAMTLRWAQARAAVPVAWRRNGAEEAHARDVAARPVETGDKADSDRIAASRKTIGIVVVAALARAPHGPPIATITATWLRTRSAASAGSRSYCPLPSGIRSSSSTLDIAGFIQPRRKRDQDLRVAQPIWH